MMPEQQIRSRIRVKVKDNGTIRRIDIPADKREKMQRLLNSNVSEIVRDTALRKMLDGHGTLCCVCRGIPTQEVTYQLEGATKVERYCNNCFNKREEHESINPIDYFVMVTKL